jgi:DNA-binding transcriptional LysR family regulator
MVAQWAMRLRHIEVFNAVMLTGSVSAAARLINVTQPAVSRTLQHAELQLGIPLFHRVRNRLVPTPEARALAPHVERVFADLDAVRRVANTLKSGAAANEVRVLSVLTLGHEVLPHALTLFRAKHPTVKVAFHTSHSSEIVAALALQEADVGFLFSAAAHPALVHDTLGGAELVCVARRGLLPARKREGISLHDIASLPVIGLDTRDPLGMMLAQAWSDAGLGLQSAVSVQTYHTALALARHGHGIAIVDACTALSASPREMDVVPLRPAVRVPLYAARPAARPASVALRAFTRAVQQALQELLPAAAAAAPPAAPSRKRA